jgi:amino acid adenylation domain-containing protein
MDAIQTNHLGQDVPLSLSQREVWLDQSAWEDSAHLNIGGSLFFKGPLDLARVRQALANMVAENESLRLAPRVDGSQQLLPHCSLNYQVLDMSHALDPEQAMRDWWQALMAQPFVLDGTPPWRFAVLRAHDELHGLTIQFHHLIMDGWGTSLVIQRWSEHYNALTNGTPVPPRPDPGYQHFVAESNSYRQSPAYERDAAYWQTQLPELPPMLIERRYANTLKRGLPAALMGLQKVPRADYNRLCQLAVERNTSAFNFFLAALVLYFGRVGNRSEVVVGVPSLNRGGRRYTHTMGMFVGVMPVVVPTHGDMTVGELLAAVGSAMRASMRHPRYPLSELGRTLEVARNRRDGLFDVLLSFERQDYAGYFGAAELVGSHQLFSGKARFPLGVTVCEFHAEQDVELAVEASDACFVHGEVELLGRRLWHLVEHLMGPLDTPLRNIPLLPQEEQWAMVDGLHKDVAAMAVVQPFISLFEHHAGLRPEASALVWDDGAGSAEMDYATLDQVSSHLAARLVASGAGPDKIVAMVLERSADMVVAMLAIAKSGAAFLPLDPEAPLARLDAILQESAAIAVLIKPHTADRLGGLHTQVLHTDWTLALADVRQNGVRRVPTKPGVRDLAYVLFTSGSTGRPKGVMIEHGHLARRLGWLSRAYAIEWGDRSGNSTQATFDPSLIELLLPLVHGASVALPPPGRLLPESLADFAIKHGVTFMAFVPSTLSRFLDAAAHRPGLKMRVACCGGEVLAPELAQRFLKETGGRLYNVYGPTETTIFATAYECENNRTDVALPIGRPIDDTRIYVLDHALRSMPLGVPGEVFIGGDAVARGYLNRPELDAQVFLPDPFHPGGRMYRTGDRGWLGSDGNLHFLGRLDRQIKLRGYRIELGEIESGLSAIEGVLQVAAKLIERDGKPQIHAWVAAPGNPSVESLQAVLRARLPDYMVPSGISVLPSLPASPAGKTDYDALPDPSKVPAIRLTRPPGRKYEPELLHIWEQVLEHRPVGVQDNFFDMGGDSLAAVSMLTAIEKLVGRKVPMYLITEHPTIETLALALLAKTKGPNVMINLGSDTGRVPLYIAASGHGDLLRFQNLARALGGTCDLYMLQPPFGDPVASIDELANLYAGCIQAHRGRPGFLAGFSVGGIAALEAARMLRERKVPLRGLFLIDTTYPASRLGGTGFWRFCSWLVRHLHVQDLSLNGRRMGAMFNDPGLVSQVMALKGYRPTGFEGSTLLIKSNGLSRWWKWLFGPWRKEMPQHLYERSIPGLHGSIFESGNVADLAKVLAEGMEKAA